MYVKALAASRSAALGWFHENDGQIEDQHGRRYRHPRC